MSRLVSCLLLIALDDQPSPGEPLPASCAGGEGGEEGAGRGMTFPESAEALGRLRRDVNEDSPKDEIRAPFSTWNF